MTKGEPVEQTITRDSGQLMTIIETEARMYPGTVLTDLTPEAFDETFKQKRADGDEILRADRKSGLLHFARSTWEEAREKLTEAGREIIEENRNEGYFLVLEQQQVAQTPLELLAETIMDEFKVLQPGTSEKITITIPNPGPGPIYIRRIAVEGVRLPSELQPPTEGEPE